MRLKSDAATAKNFGSAAHWPCGCWANWYWNIDSRENIFGAAASGAWDPRNMPALFETPNPSTEHKAPLYISQGSLYLSFQRTRPPCIWGSRPRKNKRYEKLTGWWGSTLVFGMKKWNALSGMLDLREVKVLFQDFLWIFYCFAQYLIAYFVDIEYE